MKLQEVGSDTALSLLKISESLAEILVMSKSLEDTANIDLSIINDSIEPLISSISSLINNDESYSTIDDYEEIYGEDY